MYEVLLAVHILGAVIWVGGSTALQVLATRALRAATPETMATIAGQASWIGSRIFAPPAVVLLLAGIGLVGEGGWGYGEPWIVFALAVFAFSFLLGAFVLGPEAGRLRALIDERGPADGEVRARLRRSFLLSRIELVLLLLVVVDMAVKPGA